MTSMPQNPDSKPARKAISKRIRYEILRRDNNTCRYCHATDSPLTIDHVTPTALGGTDDPGNLVAACRDCNSGKSSASPDAALVAQVSDEAIRWAAAVRTTADAMLAGDAELRDRLDAIGQYWDALIPEYRRSQPRFRLPFDWRQTVASLLASGLPDAMMLDSLDVAASRPNLDNVFRYAIGVANNKLAKLHEGAAALLADDAQPLSGQPVDDVDSWRRGFDDAFAIPLVHEHWIQARALSRLVDGSEWWNTAREVAG